MNTVLKSDSDGIRILTLNRPSVHNAFDDVMVEELTSAIHSAAEDPGVRVIKLTGSGPSFCAGADLNWMQRMASYSMDENTADAMAMAHLMAQLNAVPKPTVALLRGAVFGGGVGLVSCCDIAVADDQTTFSLSEIRLGLIPAVISPYVIAAIGARQARRYFLTGERFDAATAHRIGLIHALSPDPDAETDKMCEALLKGGPSAQSEAKSLIGRVQAHRDESEPIANLTAPLIARVRASAEAQDGITAFLSKKTPRWRG